MEIIRFSLGFRTEAHHQRPRNHHWLVVRMTKDHLLVVAAVAATTVVVAVAAVAANTAAAFAAAVAVPTAAGLGLAAVAACHHPDCRQNHHRNYRRLHHGDYGSLVPSHSAVTDQLHRLPAP